MPTDDLSYYFFTMDDGKEVCHDERALAKLLIEGVLFCSSGRHTVVLYVLCNDLFYCGCADAENLPMSEIGTLLKMHLKDNTWGVSKWCCRQRKLRPQVPIVEEMKKLGVWDDELEALPTPSPS